MNNKYQLISSCYLHKTYARSETNIDDVDVFRLQYFVNDGAQMKEEFT